MPITLNSTSPTNLTQTHEPSGITVEFIKLGHMAKTRVVAETGGHVGLLIEALAEPGVGVHKWDGVQREVKVGDDDANPKLVKVEYSIAALDQTCEVAPGFGGWFNDQLLDINGFHQSDKVEDTTEGK